jgi:hypothetical protein
MVSKAVLRQKASRFTTGEVGVSGFARIAVQSTRVAPSAEIVTGKNVVAPTRVESDSEQTDEE